MKRILLVVLTTLMLLPAWADVEINETNFPDEALRTELSKTSYDKNGDGILSESELSNITRIMLADKKTLADLTGLEHFVNLKELSIRRISNLTSVDVSKNVNLANLELIVLSNLTSVDVSKNVNLTRLQITNVGSLTSLDLSQNVNLTELIIDNASGLTSLDLSQNVNLTELNISRASSLTSLDLSKNEKLTELTISSADVLSSLTISSAVKKLIIDNTALLKDLSVKQCTDMSYLSLNNLGITELDVSGLKSLTELRVDRCTSLKTLNFSGCSSLRELFCSDLSIESMEIAGLESLTKATVNYCQLLTSLKVKNCPNLEHLECRGKSSKETALTTIDLEDCPKLNLLWCDYNLLRELVFDGVQGINNVNCKYNKLMELDLSKLVDPHSSYLFNIRNQAPDVVAVKLSKNEVGLNITDRFDVSRVSNLRAVGTAQTAKEVTIDGIRYFVFYNDGDAAESLIGADNYYDYDTKLPEEAVAELQGANDVPQLPVTLNVTSVTKHPAFIKLASTDVVKGVYGSPAPAAPAIIRSQDYDGMLTYKSSNEKVVKVDADGKLTIVGAGSATITISGAETDYRLAPKSISYEVNIDKAKVEFAYAEVKLEMIILDEVPENKLSIGVYDGTVAYKSSNTKVATVAADGKLSIVAAGVVTITASGAETANCYEATPASYELTIKKKTSSLTLSANEINVIYGGKITAPEVTKNNGYNGTLTFVSADKKVVAVSDKGVLTIVGAGETTITVTGPETSYYYAPAAVSYTVKVDKADVTFAYAEDKQEMVSLNEVPENKLSTGIYDGTVTYQTSDAKIATVDANGKLTIVKAAGVVTITASGAETANCNKPASASYELTIKIRGDVNGDGLLNQTDLEMVADCIMKGGNDQKCDINGDNTVNATDLVSLANLINR